MNKTNLYIFFVVLAFSYKSVYSMMYQLIFDHTSNCLREISTRQALQNEWFLIVIVGLSSQNGPTKSEVELAYDRTGRVICTCFEFFFKLLNAPWPTLLQPHINVTMWPIRMPLWLVTMSCDVLDHFITTYWCDSTLMYSREV